MAAFTTYKLPSIKATVTVPSWVKALEDSAGMGSEADSYGQIPLIYKATAVRANALASTPFRIMRGETEVGWPFKTGFKKLIWMTEAAMMLAGVSFWLKRKNKVTLKDLQWLNPFAMEVKSGEDYSLSFKQTMQGGQSFSQDEIVFFKEFHPTDDLTSGISPAMVALGSSKLSNYMNVFAQMFFKGGAMPVTIVNVPSGTSVEEKKRVENFFKRAATGVRNAFKVIAVSGDKDSGIDTKMITQPVKDLAMPELRQQVLEDVSWAFGVPQTMLSDAANFATAKEHRLSFWQDTVRPRAEIFIESVINEQLLVEKGLRLEFAFDELDIFQEDEEQRSSAYYNYVNAKMPPSVAAEILGIDLPSGMEFSELDTMVAEQQTTEPANERPQQVQDELRAWLRFELRRLGKEDKREFKCEHIPQALQGAIQGSLENATDKDAIKAIFRDAERWSEYP